jgi:hypothetical protein
VKRGMRVALILLVVAGGTLVGAPAASAHEKCSSWKFWEFAPSYFVFYRSCINHGSVVTGRTESYLSWGGLEPSFASFTMTTFLYKNGASQGSTFCDRTPAANQPRNHNSPSEAMICLRSLALAGGTWQRSQMSAGIPTPRSRADSSACLRQRTATNGVLHTCYSEPSAMRRDR